MNFLAFSKCSLSDITIIFLGHLTGALTSDFPPLILTNSERKGIILFKAMKLQLLK